MRSDQEREWPFPPSQFGKWLGRLATTGGASVKLGAYIADECLRRNAQCAQLSLTDMARATGASRTTLWRNIRRLTDSRLIERRMGTRDEGDFWTLVLEDEGPLEEAAPSRAGPKKKGPRGSDLADLSGRLEAVPTPPAEPRDETQAVNQTDKPTNRIASSLPQMKQCRQI